MTLPTTSIVVALFTAATAPLIAYVTAARKLSGKIDTTEAGRLWEESAAIRADYREQIAERDRRIEALDTRIEAVEEANRKLAAENLTLRDKVRSYGEDAADLLERLEACERHLIEERRRHGTDRTGGDR